MIKAFRKPQIYWNQEDRRTPAQRTVDTLHIVDEPPVETSPPPTEVPEPPTEDGETINDEVKLCPVACDVAIPIVYSDYPINVKYRVVKEKLSVLGAGVNLEKTFKSTFNNPTAIPPLSIVKANKSGAWIKGLGHAGIAFLDGRNNKAEYYEYGRYDSEGYGEVQDNKNVSNVAIDFDEMGNLSSSSFSSLMQALTKTNGSYGFEAVYIKLPNGSFDKMLEFSKKRLTDVESKKVPAYEASSNHCFTFAMEVANAAGIQTNVSSAEYLDIQVEGVFGIAGLVSSLTPNFEVPARQMLMLQKKYTKLNVSKSGSPIGDFEFPKKFY